MGLHRVGLLGGFQVVVQADGCGDARNSLLHLSHLLCRHPVLVHQVLGCRARIVDWRIGGELERVVFNLDVSVKKFNCALEFTFTDVTPGALHI